MQRVCFISFAILVAFSACSSGRPASSKTTRPIAATTNPVAEGAGLYKKYCALCHNAAAEGYAADNATQLRNPTFLQTANGLFLWFAINAGRPGTPMAAYGEEFGGPLNEKQILALMEYLRSYDPKSNSIDVDNVAVHGDPELGARTYQRECSACHGDAGKGKTGPTLNNPTFLATASDGFIRYAIQKGRPSTPMPAFDRLTEEEIAGTTAYIRSWASTVESASVKGVTLPSRDAIILNPEGPTPDLGVLKAGRYISVDKLASELQRRPRMVLLDARVTSDWYKSHIDGAFPAPYYSDVQPLLEMLPRDGTWIVAYCGCPHAASDKVVDGLRANGFRNTAVVEEGFFVWLQRGYPSTFGRRD